MLVVAVHITPRMGLAKWLPNKKTPFLYRSGPGVVLWGWGWGVSTPALRQECYQVIL